MFEPSIRHFLATKRDSTILKDVRPETSGKLSIKIFGLLSIQVTLAIQIKLEYIYIYIFERDRETEREKKNITQSYI